jgi:hypothetical protein
LSESHNYLLVGDHDRNLKLLSELSAAFQAWVWEQRDRERSA